MLHTDIFTDTLTKHIKKNKKNIIKQLIGRGKKKTKQNVKEVNFGAKSFYHRICSPVIETAIDSKYITPFTPQLADFCVHSLHGQDCCWMNDDYEHIIVGGSILCENISHMLLESMVQCVKINDVDIYEHLISGVLNDKNAELHFYVDNNEIIKIGFQQRKWEMIKKDISKNGYSPYERIEYGQKIKLRSQRDPRFEVAFMQDLTVSPNPKSSSRNFIIGCGYYDSGDSLTQNLYVPRYLTTN
eukprot:504225_1